MSFYRIEDPEKRDALVEDYVATMKRLKDRAMKERMGDTFYHEQMEQQYAPVVRSTEVMTKAITKALKPIKEEVQRLNGQYVKVEPESSDEDDEEEEDLPSSRKRRRGIAYGPLARKWRKKILSHDPDVDRSFGIWFQDNGTMKMGNKVVYIDGNDIIVDGRAYEGTEGLWTLIAGKKRDQIVDKYTKKDMREYIEILKVTYVLHRDFDPFNHHPRANGTWKWKRLLRNIWYGLKDKSPPPSSEDEDDRVDEDEGKNEEQKSVNDEVVNASGSGLRDLVKSCKIYVQKKGKCYRVQKKGKGFFLSHQNRIPNVDTGLFIRKGRNLYNGEGLLLGRNSPFKNIPILGWIL